MSAQSPYATLAVIQKENGWGYSFAGYSAPNSRTVPTIRMIEKLMRSPTEEGFPPGVCFVQYDDFAHHEVRSVAFGRRKDAISSVGLIPDTYFFDSRGYDRTREAVLKGTLPRWEDRKDIAFWRGSPTSNWRLPDGNEIREFGQIPRVSMCERLRGDPRCDAAIGATWGHRYNEADQKIYCESRNIFRPGIPMLQHAGYKYILDIDGVANAWSLFDKLLMGSCVLKVESTFEQWYYNRIRPWIHYVPVKADLSDLESQLQWGFDHTAEARAIGAEAQKFALSHSFDHACNEARAEMRNHSLKL